MPFQSIWQATAGSALSKVGAVVDGANANVTTDPYGRLIALPITLSDHGSAAEGSYFVASNGVAGAPIADQTVNSPNSSVPSDVAPGLLVYNGNIPGGPNVYLRRIFRFMVNAGTAVQTGVTVQGQLDLGTLYSSAGTKLTVANANPAGKQTGAAVYAGAIVKAAKTTNVIYCARSSPRSTIAIASDEYIWRFGATEGPSSFISSTAGATRQVLDVGSVVIPPGWTFSLHFAYGITVTGSPTSDWEVGYIER